jgi:hypothetical protein
MQPTTDLHSFSVDVADNGYYIVNATMHSLDDDGQPITSCLALTPNQFVDWLDANLPYRPDFRTKPKISVASINTGKSK